MNNNNTYSYPSSLKKLRACTGCHLVKTEEQFSKHGCENCSETYNYTPNFKGIIAIMNPKGSWAAKWLHHSMLLIKVAERIPGFYCVDIAQDDDELDNNYDQS